MAGELSEFTSMCEEAEWSPNKKLSGNEKEVKSM